MLSIQQKTGLCIVIKFFCLPIIRCMTPGAIIIKITELTVMDILMTIPAGILVKFYNSDSSFIPQVTGRALEGCMPSAEWKFCQVMVKSNIGPGTIPVTMLTSG